MDFRSSNSYREIAATNDAKPRGRRAPKRKPGRPRKTGPVLGKIAGTTQDFSVKLAELMATRLLIQGASGSGKSYALRRLLEQTQHVQQIVIDPEGELVTLADRFPYIVLSADSDEAPLRPHSASQLATTLLRSGHSAILCLDGFEVEDMQDFVANFIKGLMAITKEDYRYLILAIDEAQLFAPQQDVAESKKPMLDLAARGRKRGFCPVIATQRLSQLHKGVASHLLNKLVGLTTLDNDVERAAEQLGMKTSKAAELLRSLDRGEFMSYGPALTYDVSKVMIGAVQTPHGALDKFTEKRARKTMTRKSVLAEVKKLSTVMPEPEGGGIPASIAIMRRWVIAPLLEKREHGSVAARARELELDYQEVSKWLRDFRRNYATEDLYPKQIRQGMIRDLNRLRPMIQGAPLMFMGGPAVALAA